MRLNVGCGDLYAAGWCNVDLHEDGPRPDVVASILALPFADSTFARVYLGHVLEHVAVGDLAAGLGEVLRVLQPGGELAVVGPDVNLTAIHEPVLLDGVVHGGCRWAGDEHLWTATGEATLDAVCGAGFDAELVPVGSLDGVWPVVDRLALWQFAIAATKGV